MSMQVSRQAGKNGRSHVLWLWGPVVGYCALIFLLSAQSDLSPPVFSLEYGVLGILWVRGVKASWPHWTFLLRYFYVSLRNVALGAPSATRRRIRLTTGVLARLARVASPFRDVPELEW